MTKNLVIVESPAKAKTIENFLGNEYTVKSCFGHIRDLSKNEISVDIEKDFTPKYEIPADKVKIISELKKLSDKAETVWLASDEDREGEAISWHLVEALNIDEKKIQRIVFHEITKNAIVQAIQNPRKINKNLVDAQQARRVLDRLVGYELSPLLWKKVKPALSAGRVQSVAVRLIVEREEEIRNFIPVSFYKIVGIFDYFNDKKNYKIKAEIPVRFQTKKEALDLLSQCINAEFKVENIEKKPGKKSPAPPFTTSTLQQEAGRKLGFSVSKTMMIAQQLYEAGKITYMRTDSVNLSKLALSTSKKEIEKNFGAEYLHTRNYITKTKGAQEAHEAIRPTYMEYNNIDGTNDQKKLYDLIWKRTIASQMSDAILEKTNIYIGSKSVSEKFVATGEVVRFDGFLKVYLESSDDEEDESQKDLLPPIQVNEKVFPENINASERFTIQQSRFNEAGLVKKMEELGIGRPSTYAPTISTIQKREYVEIASKEGKTREYNVINLCDGKITELKKSEVYGYEKNKLFPTDIGILVTNYLKENFLNILDYGFTANVEKEFDEIAEGKENWNKMIKQFYKPFNKQITEALTSTGRVSGNRLLGTDPGTGKNVYVKLGKYGPMIQVGENDDNEKPKFVGLMKDQKMDTITLEEALALFAFPKTLGKYQNEEVSIGIGRFGPFIKHKGVFVSLPKSEKPQTIELKKAIELIEEKNLLKTKSVIREFPDNPGIKVLNGRYGPYISADGKNYRIPKNQEPAALSIDECMEIIKAASATVKHEKKVSKTAPRKKNKSVKTGKTKTIEKRKPKQKAKSAKKTTKSVKKSK